MKGLVHIYTGHGKGKTTAALGVALRAVGQGKKVLVIQFIKGRDFKTGEKIAAKKFLKNLKILSFGKGFVNIFSSSEEKIGHENAARIALIKAGRAIKKGSWDLVILDEICLAQKMGFIKLEEILKLVEGKPKKMNLILTGRYAHLKLQRAADLVTEMKKVKHPFDKGVTARKGLEY